MMDPEMFDWKKPTAQMLGRYQPFHAGHLALARESIRRVGQVAIMVRDTGGTDAKNPFDFETVRRGIEEGMAGLEGSYVIIPVPNVTMVFYGRDVGYGIEKLEMGPEIEAISATAARKAMGL